MVSGLYSMTFNLLFTVDITTSEHYSKALIFVNWCPSEGAKITEVLKIKGKKKMNRKEFCHKCALNRSISRVYFKIFSSGLRGHITLRLPLSKVLGPIEQKMQHCV